MVRKSEVQSPGRAIPKTQKILLDAALLNTKFQKVRVEGKEEQSKERSSVSPLHLGVVAIEKGAYESPSTKAGNFTFIWFQVFLLNTTNFHSYIISAGPI